MAAPQSGEPAEYVAYVIQRLAAEDITFDVTESLEMPPIPDIPGGAVLQTQHHGRVHLWYPRGTSPEDLAKLVLIGVGRTFVAMGDTCPSADEDSKWTYITTTGVSPEEYPIPADMLVGRFMATTDSEFRGVRKLLLLSHQLLHATTREEAVLNVLRMDVSDVETEFLLKMWESYTVREPDLCDYWHVIERVKVELVEQFFRTFKRRKVS